MMAGDWGSLHPELLVPLRLEQIEQALSRGQPAQALLEAEELLDDQPQHPQALWLSGQAALALGNAVMAQQALRQCAEGRPSDPLVQQALSRASLLSVELEEARRAASQALAREARLPAAWQILGLIQERTGQEQAAVQSFQNAHEIDPDQYPLPLDLPQGRWLAALDEALSGLPSAIQAFYAQVPLTWAQFPDPGQLKAQFPPLSPLIGALYQGSLPPQADPWQTLPSAVVLFQGNLRHVIPPASSLSERICEALVAQALEWTGAPQQDILPD